MNNEPLKYHVMTNYKKIRIAATCLNPVISAGAFMAPPGIAVHLDRLEFVQTSELFSIKHPAYY